MSTEFISLQTPPGAAVRKYKPGQPASDQHEDIPPHFCDAMSIREEVFVHEQAVAPDSELDEDDARSWHWVTYVSMGTSSATSVPSDGNLPKLSNSESPTASQHARKGSTASRIAAATIRLVPPPHAPHADPASGKASEPSPSGKDGAELTISHSRTSSGGAAATTPISPADPHSIHNPDSEPYIKLGRLATLQPFRKLGLGRLLIETALEWASAHADDILPPPSATDREAARAETMDDGEWAKEYEKRKWRGLVLVHAQTSVMEWYKKRGFVLDEGLGSWDEEGIEHVGMWYRVGIKDKRA